MLSLVLVQAGTAIEGLVPKLPDLVSSERVHISRSAASLLGSSSLQEAQLRQSPSKEFNYLLLHRQNADGSTTLEEYRSDLRNRRVDLSDQQQGFPSSYGFAYAWLLFLPANQREAKFKYLGQQKIEGHETFVVAFAQDPDQVKIPCQFMSKGKPTPFFYQGVAWVDQLTFRIVMLHTDLLRPLSDVRLTQMTAEVFFQTAHIRGIDLDLWLPQQVLIISERGSQRFAELHEYSNYRLYRAKTRIVPAP
jgi:hypothetical protein